MKRWVLTFIITVVFAKMLASGLNKIMPDAMGPVFAKLSPTKIIQLFERKKAEAPQAVQPVLVAQNNFRPPVVVAPVAPKFIQPVKNDKKAKLVAKNEEEKKRRKKRKKKLEKALDKKPTLSVTALANNDKKKPVEVNGIGPVSLVTSVTEKPEQPKPAAPAEVAPSKKDAAYWFKLLNSQPTTANLKNFVAYYKSKNINAKVYYTVVAQLQRSANKEVRRLAILASSIEPHLDAFEILANEKNTESDAELKALATARLIVYKDVQFLSFLVQPLTQGDLFTKIEASDLVGQIVRNLGTTPQTLTAESRQALTQIMAALTSLSTNSNAQLQALSQQVLGDIKKILNIVA